MRYDKKFARFEFIIDSKVWVTPIIGIEIEAKELGIAILCFAFIIRFKKNEK